jgi:hypothetical protein
LHIEKKIDTTREEYIAAVELYEQYHSVRCWTTRDMARSIFDQLKSESAKLEAVKEQILMRFLGLGWVDAHHPWSAKGEVFNAIHLFHHFIEKVLPLANKLEVPSEPPANFPSPPEMVSLGTMSELSCMFVGNGDTLENLKKSAIEKRKILETEGKMDRWSAIQRHIIPELDESFIGFNIEMLFQYDNDDGTMYLNWCHGVVTSIVSQKSRYVLVKWDRECLDPGGPKMTKEKLLVSRWNPKKAPKGSWREYFGH